MAAEQVARYGYEQPEPQDEHEHSEEIGHEVGECEAARNSMAALRFVHPRRYDLFDVPGIGAHTQCNLADHCSRQWNHSSHCPSTVNSGVKSL
jgi:hypothetical protein